MDLSKSLTDERTSPSPCGLRLAVLLAGLSCASAVSAPTVDAQSPRPRPGQQVVLVTGSTSGLGREVARRLGSMGAFVIVHGRNRERGMEVVEAMVLETVELLVEAGVDVNADAQLTINAMSH